MAASMIAAVVARARREVGEHFQSHEAFSPAQAVAFDPPTRMHARQLDLLIGRGIVKETADGRYWFDRAGWKSDEERRTAAAKQMIILICLGVLIASVVVAFLRR